MTDILTDLISKLEQAEEGSRELDARVAVEVKFIHTRRGLPIQIADFAAEFGIDATAAVVCDRISAWSELVPRYTASLDAAITLAPAGHWWTAGDCRREKHARVAPEAVDNDGWEGFGATVALALCIAALKARQSMEGEGR